MSSGLQFLPGDVEQSLLALLEKALGDGADVQPLGEKDLGDNDELVIQLPGIRTRYIGSRFTKQHDNLALNYDVDHMFEIWCAAENLTSKEDQRNDTLALVQLMLPQIAGARLVLSDGETKSEPIRMIGIDPFPQDIVGMVYITTAAVPGIAQFPGING
jgi:hypothetical protein